MGGGNDEREQTINQLLTEMDGFEGNTGVIVLVRGVFFGRVGRLFDSTPQATRSPYATCKCPL